MADEHRTRFDTYRVHYRTGGNEPPSIDCFFKEEQVGRIAFHRGQTPANSIETNAGGGAVLRLNYRLDQFPHVMDLLREEKPLYLTLSESGLAGGVNTGSEPVGESEPSW